jgi:CheY-like chemotaxis protein
MNENPPSAPTGRVLLADDGADNQLLVSTILRRAGYEVTIAGDGQQACELALTAWRQRKPFDIVLMDMEMPVLDGFCATARLRRDGYPGFIVALTGHTDPQDRAACLAAGCDEHLGKPVMRSPLLERMAQWMQSRCAGGAGSSAT